MYSSDSDLTDARRDLAFVRSLVTEHRQRFIATWQHQLLWGCVTLTGLMATWTAIQLESAWLGNATWPVLVGLGWLGTASIEWTRSRTLRARPAEGSPAHLFGGIWIGTGAALTLVGVGGSAAGVVSSQALPMIVAVLLGTGYFATGHLAHLGWLRRVGVAWWAVGITLLWVPGPASLLVLATAVVVLTLGPALVLRSQDASPEPAA